MPHKNFGRVIHCFEIGLHTSQPHQYGNWLWTAAAYLNPEVQIHIHHLPARSLSQTSLLTRPECTPTRPNATLSSPQTCFSSCISLCGERYCWTTSATILTSFVLPFYPTNRSRNPLPVVSPSPQPWMTRAAFLLPGLLARPDLSPPRSTSIHSLCRMDLSKVYTWPRNLPRQAPSGKHVRRVRPLSPTTPPASSSPIIPLPEPSTTPQSSEPLQRPFLLPGPLTAMLASPV